MLVLVLVLRSPDSVLDRGYVYVGLFFSCLFDSGGVVEFDVTTTKCHTILHTRWLPLK